MKVLLENLLRFEDGRSVTKEHILAVAEWLNNKGAVENEIAYRPARVLMQDFTGVPAVVDLAAMRDAMVSLGGDPEKINPLVPVDLVIDHSVIVDEFGTPQAFARNVELEYERNGERYRFLKWGQQAFKNFRVVPPGTGICHQVNLEYLGQTVWTKEEDGETIAYPDTCVGTDSHTTMINGLGVLGWGVGGIEAEAAMLGQPVSMLLPEVIGFKLTGKLKEGVTATDLVLTVVQMLRKKGVVSKFVEFFGPGLDNMTLADRATIGNMGPEYGATCGFFPVDGETINYLTMSGRDARPHRAGRSLFQGARHVARRRRLPTSSSPTRWNSTSATSCRRWPARSVRKAASRSKTSHPVSPARIEADYKKPGQLDKRYAVEGTDFDLGHGDVAIAAITSCTNTSNPSVLIAAGLLARNAVAKGLKTEALGQDVAGTGIAGRRRISRQVRPAGRSRQARLQPRRLRLHDLHRQFRPAAGADLEDDQRQGPDRVRRSLGQPQLRRPHLAGRPGELPRLAAAGRRLCARRYGPEGPDQGADRRRPETATRSSSRTSGRPRRKSRNSS